MPDTDLPRDERPSKSELKRQAHELQDLGEAMLALPDERLAALPMSDTLLEAVRELKRTRSHEGRRRQMQYVGKLMRQHSAEQLEPLREAVAQSQLGRAKDTLALHRAERWRDELLADEDALTRWLAAHPGSDTQHLRSLVRAARKDAATPEARHGRAYRELFQFIKQGLNDDGQ
jgi:ribosome-associated protein